MKAGAKVEAVLDTAPLRAKLNLLRGLALQPGVILRGMRYAAELVARGVPVRYGVEPVRVEGDARVDGHRAGRSAAQRSKIACDALGFGSGLRSETQLADLAGCRFVFDARDRALASGTRWGRAHQRARRLYRRRRRRHCRAPTRRNLAASAPGWACSRTPACRVDCIAHPRSRTKIRRARAVSSILESAFPFPDGWAEKLAGRRGALPLRGDRGRQRLGLRRRDGRDRDQSPEGADAASAWAAARAGCAATPRRSCSPHPAASRSTPSDGCARRRRSSRCRSICTCRGGGRMSRTLSADVAIIGGGLVGSSAALALRRMRLLGGAARQGLLRRAGERRELRRRAPAGPSAGADRRCRSAPTRSGRA